MLIDLDEPESVPISGSSTYPYDRGAPGRIAVGSLVCGSASIGIVTMTTTTVDVWFVYLSLAILVILVISVYLYMLSASKRSIQLDFDRRVVVLRNMVYPIRFWDITSRDEACVSFSDIQFVEVQRGRWQCQYRVHTKHSRFVFSDHFEHAEALVEQLRLISRANPQPRFVRRFESVIMFAAVVVFAGAIILALGWMLGWI
jgi:hypothetical protein